MELEEHYGQLLGIESSWENYQVDLKLEEQRVDIRIEYTDDQGPCPECGAMSSRYDLRKERTRRHLDTMQFATFLHGEVPRVRCEKHGVKSVTVPWAGKNSRFTLLFEAFAIRVLEGGRVLDVIEGRTETDAKRLIDQALTPSQQAGVTAVALEMWQAYANAVGEKLPQADIVHDRFHISQHLNQAVDRVRRAENKELDKQGDSRLKGTRYHWLRNEKNIAAEDKECFAKLKKSELKVARAWALKELFREFWNYRYAGWAARHFERWYAWAIRSRLEPIKEKARMIKTHLSNILTYFKHRISNGVAEGLNSRIQTIKANARGYRSFDGFGNSILFYCGGLNMEPEVPH